MNSLQACATSGFSIQGGQASASKEVRLQPPRRLGLSLQGSWALASKEAGLQPPRRLQHVYLQCVLKVQWSICNLSGILRKFVTVLHLVFLKSFNSKYFIKNKVTQFFKIINGQINFMRIFVSYRQVWRTTPIIIKR